MGNYRIYKIIVLILFTAFVVPNGYSSNFLLKCNVSGIVRDSASNDGLPFASVQILSAKDSSFIKGTLSDINGKYLIEDIENSEYLIVASYMGYSDYRKELVVQAKRIKCDFSLIKKSISLAEVSISAEMNILEKAIDKTTVNVSKNMTVVGGTATDVMQTLPSIDIDIDGIINYRGSDKVMILVNGERSELTKSLDQIPADQIQKVELINNPSAKYEADGMSGIINIVLKTGQGKQNKTTLMVNAGYPETLGGTVGYSGSTSKANFIVNGGFKRKSQFQTKEHLRENYENLAALNYYQYDRQDQLLNDAFFNSSYQYSIDKRQKIGVSLIGSKKFNSADRTIDYETLYINIT